MPGRRPPDRVGNRRPIVGVHALLAAPRPVSAAALADRLWDDPRPSARKTVQGHASPARSFLGAAGGLGGALAGGATGYRLDADTGRLDVRAVDDLRRHARTSALAGDDHAAARLLCRARDLWRGEPEPPPTLAGEAEWARLADEHLLLVEDHSPPWSPAAPQRPPSRSSRH